MSDRVHLSLTAEELSFLMDVLKMYYDNITGMPIDICACQFCVDEYEHMMSKVIKLNRESNTNDSWSDDNWQKVISKNLS